VSVHQRTILDVPLIYSSTGAAYKGGSEGKTDKGGSLVVQGQKDRSLETRGDTGKTRRDRARERFLTRETQERLGDW
jgi:hypothetical protein